MEELRAEILEAERARSDLLKWKLVLVAALAAFGLGLNPDTEPVPLVLIAVPLVCAYVDLICRHLTPRVHVIGGFLRTRKDRRGDPAEAAWRQRFFREYEERAQEKHAAFGFENWALFWSSALLSLVVGLYGLHLYGDTERWWAEALIVSGTAGVLLTLAVEWTFEARKAKIDGDEGPLVRWWRYVIGGE
jgi:hypothetical protein